MADIDNAQLRDALAWETDDYDKAKEASTNPVVWLWQVLQGDFNENASTAQALTAAGIGALPLAGQVCSVRDLIADCNRLRQDPGNTWYWTALTLTLIGLFPSLGALVKGVLGIFFGIVRRMGGNAVIKAIDVGMGWVISYLRRRSVQNYIAALKIDDIFGWLAKQVKTVKGVVTVKALTDAFDTAVGVLDNLAGKVSFIPVLGDRVKAVAAQVKKIRDSGDEYLAKAVSPVQEILDRIVLRLEHEALKSRRGIINANNVHFQGGLPEDAAMRLMREADPLPEWLSMGNALDWDQAVPDKYQIKIEEKVKNGWPSLNDGLVTTFHKLVPDEIYGPARLYRVIAPGSRSMSNCWISEAVFKNLQAAANPRAAWRKYLAVWPDWNANGQFVIYDVKRGESLKIWRGPTSSQINKKLADLHLEGGWEQIVFNVERTSPLHDTMAYYKEDGGAGRVMGGRIDRSAYDKLSDIDKKSFTELREKINHPSISGPFETGWGYTDFGGDGLGGKIGLPNLPGQMTTLRN